MMERCKTCRHWFHGLHEDGKMRVCVLLTGMQGEPLDSPLTLTIRTRPDFGCTCHEPRTTESHQ